MHVYAVWPLNHRIRPAVLRKAAVRKAEYHWLLDVVEAGFRPSERNSKTLGHPGIFMGCCWQ